MFLPNKKWTQKLHPLFGVLKYFRILCRYSNFEIRTIISETRYSLLILFQGGSVCRLKSSVYADANLSTEFDAATKKFQYCYHATAVPCKCKDFEQIYRYFFNCMKTKKKSLNNRSIFQFLPGNVQHFRGSQNKLYSVPTLWFVVMISDNIKSLINGPSTHLFVVILKQWWWKAPCLQPKTIQVTR